MTLKKIWLGLPGAILLVGSSGGLLARDLPKSDPDRLAMLNAARETPSVKFVVEDFVKDGDYGYLCAFTMRPDAKGRDNYDRGDGDSYLIRYFTFRKNAAAWQVLDRGNDFSGSPKGATEKNCHISIRNKFDIVKATLPKPF